MQSAQSIGRALYRIVFRGGTPQRIQYSTQLLLTGIGLTLVCTVVSGRYFFSLSAVEIGLVLFTLLSGLYIGAALLTRSVPRAKLRASLLTVLLLLALAGLVLVLLIPLRGLEPMFVPIAGLIVLTGVISGTTNTMQYARGGSRASAALTTIAFAATLGALYATLRWLLETVFS
ncbi:MAG: hypothetical protein EP301_07445 [Gammaproteobacteria bacterium]|nr:MAG: hypothetical protein EP301_07445 [Gammaproteobacteria bacterium]